MCPVSTRKDSPDPRSQPVPRIPARANALGPSSAEAIEQPRPLLNDDGAFRPQPDQATTLARATGGGRGIRTPETVARLHAFQACAFNHSATPPHCAADYSDRNLWCKHVSCQHRRGRRPSRSDHCDARCDPAPDTHPRSGRAVQLRPFRFLGWPTTVVMRLSVARMRDAARFTSSSVTAWISALRLST